jgi:Zn-dependent metalloprotease
VVRRALQVHGYGLGHFELVPVVAIDVAGHEMTHGVTEATPASRTPTMPAASTKPSDIMGTMVEYFANNADDGRTT